MPATKGYWRLTSKAVAGLQHTSAPALAALVAGNLVGHANACKRQVPALAPVCANSRHIMTATGML